MSWTKNTPVIIPGTVFVGGLGREVGEEQLEEIFSMLGKVEKVVVVMEKDGGYGFVTFQDYMVLRKVEQEEITVGGRLLRTAQAVGMVPVTAHQEADGQVGGGVKLGGEVGHDVELAHHLLHELGGRQRVVQGEMLVHRNTVVNGPLYFFSGVPDKGTF